MNDLDDATRARLIARALVECHQEPTFAHVAAQFRYETGRALPEMWARTPPKWMSAGAEAASARPLVGREDGRE